MQKFGNFVERERERESKSSRKQRRRRSRLVNFTVITAFEVIFLEVVADLAIEEDDHDQGTRNPGDLEAETEDHGQENLTEEIEGHDPILTKNVEKNAKKKNVKISKKLKR